MYIEKINEQYKIYNKTKKNIKKNKCYPKKFLKKM